MSKNGKEKTPTNPHGAGRPRKEGTGGDATGTPPPPRPPSPDDVSSGAAQVQANAKAARSIKVTPAFAYDLGKQVVDIESGLYDAWSTLADDPRLVLTEAEKTPKVTAWGTFIYMYADVIAGWIPVVALAITVTAPLVVRLTLPPLKKSNMGAPVTERERAKGPRPV